MLQTGQVPPGQRRANQLHKVRLASGIQVSCELRVPLKSQLRKGWIERAPHSDPQCSPPPRSLDLRRKHTQQRPIPRVPEDDVRLPHKLAVARGRFYAWKSSNRNVGQCRIAPKLRYRPDGSGGLSITNKQGNFYPRNANGSAQKVNKTNQQPRAQIHAQFISASFPRPARKRPVR